MRWSDWRRSDQVEDYRDPAKPIEQPDLSEFYQSINEQLKITNSTLAKDAGGDSIRLGPVKLIDNWRQAHRMGSVQFAAAFGILNGAVFGLSAFNGLINPYWFLGLNVIGYALVSIARLVYQPKLHNGE